MAMKTRYVQPAKMSRKDKELREMQLTSQTANQPTKKVQTLRQV